MAESILDWYIKNALALAFDSVEIEAAPVDGVANDDAWITVHPNESTGRHVLLDDDGYIKSGMGGTFKGQRIDLIPRKGNKKPTGNEPVKPAQQRYKLKPPTKSEKPKSKRTSPNNKKVAPSTPKAEPKQPKTAHVFTRTSSWGSRTLVRAGVEYNEVKALSSPRSEEEIIKTVGGGDKTSGSCASVALAYIGQKIGYDVGDFRDGESREFFSGKTNKDLMFESCSIKTDKFSAASSSLENGMAALNRLEKGKEYYLGVGRHAAIVRRDPITGYPQYLELQTPDRNGWESFGGSSYEREHRLKQRFGCVEREPNASLSARSARLTEISQFKDNDSFLTVLGYLNTSGKNQRKGASGRAR